MAVEENAAFQPAPATKSPKVSSQLESQRQEPMDAFDLLSALFGRPDSPRSYTSRADRDRPHHPAAAQRQHAAAIAAAREREETERRRRRQRAMELAAAQERERQYAEYLRELERQRRREQQQLEREREEREYRRALTAERHRRQQQREAAAIEMMMDPFAAMCRGSSYRRQRAAPVQYVSTMPAWAW
ncbi:hypothetical protein H9P43_003349 [Blastocladiella emersonii ATCC 22665]|nr:hypothetical protein H9P43_003349 [Blastocladiella emersonii ATCC 22665]